MSLQAYCAVTQRKARYDAIQRMVVQMLYAKIPRMMYSIVYARLRAALAFLYYVDFVLSRAL
jgi:hypothetical protein